MEQDKTPSLTPLFHLNKGSGDSPNPCQAARSATHPVREQRQRLPRSDPHLSPGKPSLWEMHTETAGWGLAHFGLLSSNLCHHRART